MKSFILLFALLMMSCSSTKHLVYIDEWEGMYKLREYSSCCDTTTTVRLDIKKLSTNSYNWKMFFEEVSNKDSLFGKAIYEQKQLKFFVENVETASKYFVDEVKFEKPIFRMEYDNYYSDKAYHHVYYFTRWYNEMKRYRSQNKFAAGIDYHFRSDDKGKKMLSKG